MRSTSQSPGDGTTSLQLATGTPVYNVSFQQHSFLQGGVPVGRSLAELHFYNPSSCSGQFICILMKLRQAVLSVEWPCNEHAQRFEAPSDSAKRSHDGSHNALFTVGGSWREEPR